MVFFLPCRLLCLCSYSIYTLWTNATTVQIFLRIYLYIEYSRNDYRSIEMIWESSDLMCTIFIHLTLAFTSIVAWCFVRQQYWFDVYKRDSRTLYFFKWIVKSNVFVSFNGCVANIAGDISTSFIQANSFKCVF